MTSGGEAVLFWVLAPISVIGALGLIFAKKAVHAALGMALVMINLGVFYIAQNADFLGIVQIFVYTGAVMMLFLFVLMLVGVDSSNSLVETIKGPDKGLHRWLSVVISVPHAAPRFQRPLLFPHLNVLDNVAFAGRVTGTPRRQARAEVARFLELVQLPGFGSRLVGELSGGREQRVAWVRALAARPRVLLLGEPFSALDAALRADMHELLRELRAVLEPTVVLVTHDQNEAAALAESIAVLSGGRLAQHDSVDRVYARPASLTVARLMGGLNEIDGVVAGRHHHSPLGQLRLPDDVRVHDGPGVLVIRQVSVEVTGAADPAAGAYGTLAAVRVVGARRLVSVEVPGRSRPATATHRSRACTPNCPRDLGSALAIAWDCGSRHKRWLLLNPLRRRPRPHPTPAGRLRDAPAPLPDGGGGSVHEVKG